MDLNLSLNRIDELTNEQLEQRFREQLITLATAFREKGYPVQPFREKAWRNFLTIPREEKRKIFANFSTYYDIYLPVLLEAGNPNEDGRLIWAALKRFGLRPCADLFNQISQDNIIEFYSPSGLQIFHNINFFDVCSYSFLEIFAYPFTELWSRDETTFQETKQVAIDGFAGKFKSTVDAHLPQQYLVEAFSAEKLIIELTFTKFSPLYDSQGNIAALAILSRGQVISDEKYRQILEERPYLPKPEARSNLRQLDR